MERGRVKCKQYWPENGDIKLHEYLRLTHVETMEYGDHVERQLRIEDTRVSCKSKHVDSYRKPT